MKLIVNQVKDDKDFVSLINKIYNKVKDYFSSSKVNNQSREETYSKYGISAAEGGYIGTKMSSLKGKNISMCTEKSIAAYIILKELCVTGTIGWKPALVISKLATEKTEPGPHVFVMLNKDNDISSVKHILFDVENLAPVEDKNGIEYHFVGLYALSDEEYDKLISGSSCSPTSLYELLGAYRDIGDKRTYGNPESTETRKGGSL